MDSDVEELLAGLSDAESPKDYEKQEMPSGLKEDTLDSQIAAEFLALKESYSQRSPAIDNIILSPEQYAQLVRIIGNSPEINQSMQENLIKRIGNDCAVKVSIAFTEPTRKELDPSSFETVLQHLNNLESFLSTQNEQIAELMKTAKINMPNLTAIINPRTAALLLLKTGGLKQLGLTPAANLTGPTTSPLAKDKLVIEVPTKHRKQALRILSGKIVLAARLDLQSPSKLNPISENWRRNIEHRIGKLLAPPKAVQERALPKPVDKKSKRRGGKRHRTQKLKQQKQIKPEFIKFANPE